jgi:hypothetical protein
VGLYGPWGIFFLIFGNKKLDAFSYNVIDYDLKKKEYTLKHPKTGEIKIISKEDFDYYMEQEKKNKKRKNGS